MLMHGVVSILPPPFYEQVETLWDLLEEQCGLRAIREVPIPHFSWHIAQDYDLDALDSELRAIAKDMEPFEATTAGLGVFSGEQPVVYIPVVRSAELTAIHQRLWGETLSCASKISPHYAPEAWMPHITLANKDVDAHSLACAMQTLGEQRLDWTFQVDNFATVLHQAGQIGQVHAQYQFQATDLE